MEDVTSLTKEEFLKFLNCSHHSTKPERIIVSGPKNTKFSVLKRFGKYSACDLKLEEFSLNRQVLRIPLPKIDLENLTPKQVALKFKTRKSERKRKNHIVSRFGRRLKKKQLNIHSLTGIGVSTRSSSSKYPTRNLEKNKLLKFGLKPNSINRLNRQHIIHRVNSLKIKKKPQPEHKKASKMDSWSPSLKQAQDLKQLSLPLKPQFIIKYVPTEPTYFLKMNPLRHPQDGKLKYSFDTLVKDIKNMKLPSPTWKIKVVVKSNRIASIIFTNKCVLERTVSFNAKSEYFEVVIENRPAILLGSPNAVTCVEDIEILLNIIHTISAKNPMVYYKD